MEYDNDGGNEEVIESLLCVVGRLLTEKPLNFVAFKQIMAAMWRPVKGMPVKELGNNAFLIIGILCRAGYANIGISWMSTNLSNVSFK